MTDASLPPTPFPLGRWVKVMTAGWLLGLALLLALAMAWNVTGLESQWMVGAGMAAGVALLQARFLGGRIRKRAWVIASIVTMAIPFVLWDVSRAVQVPLIPGLPAAAAIGSILLGLVQGRMLWNGGRPIGLWTFANLLGWGIPVGIMGLGEAAVLGGWGGILSTMTMFLGGAVLGLCTGTALRRIPFEASLPSATDPQPEA